MSTGKIEYAPDYKSQRRRVNVRISKETGGAYADPREVINDELARIRKSVSSVARKHAHLQAAVVEAVRKWHHNDKGFTRIPIHLAMDRLLAFEAEHKVGPSAD